MEPTLQKKYVRKYKESTEVLFFVLVHRMSRERRWRGSSSNNPSKGGADAARITDENAGSEDRKQTSGGVFVAIDSNVGAVIDTKKVVMSIPGSERRIAQAWVTVCMFLRCISGTWKDGRREAEH